MRIGSFIITSVFLSNLLLGQTNSVLGGASVNVACFPNDSVCLGTNVTLKASTSAYACWWSSPYKAQFVKTPDPKEVSIQFNAPGTYTLSVMVISGGCFGGASIVITVFPNPIVSLNINPKVLCTGTNTVQLSGGSPVGGIYSGAGLVKGIVYNASLSKGTEIYSYTYTDANGCSATATDVVTVMDCFDNSEQRLTRELTIYPNPSSENILLSTQVTESKTACIYNLSGEKVKEISLSELENNISISDLEKGIYYISVDGCAKKKFIKD